MPPGLIISKSSSSGGNATWQVSGTPTSPGSGSGVYTFTDSNPGSVTMTINFNILSPVVPAATFPQGTAGRPFPSTNTSASGGSGAGYSYSVSGGNLPTGLNLANNGTLTGTSSVAGTFNFSVQATDSLSNVGNANFSITINPAVTMGAAATIQRTVGQTYIGSYSGTGGTAPLGYSVSSGALPPGAALSSTTAALTGTASAASTGSFIVTLTDANGSAATRSISHTISALPVISLATPSGIVGSAYAQTISFTGALATASLSAGALPPGLSLSQGGTAVSGNPTTAGSYSFSLSGTDTNGVVATAAFSITIAGALSITTSSLPAATPGAAYSASVASLGGIGAIAFSISAGALPTGLSLGSTGSISGTPSAPGLATFTVLATDSASNSASRQLSIQVNSPPVVISTNSLPSASIGSAYSAAIAASGGSGSLTFSLSAGTLPSGLALASSGSITGTPLTAGVANFTILASDGFSNSSSKAFSITVISPISISSNTSLPPTTAGATVQFQFQTLGGTAPFTWTSTGSPAPGLVFSGGLLSGAPTVAGLSQFSIQVSDANGATASAIVTQTVNPPLSILNPSLGGPFSRTGSMDLLLLGIGGTLPYSWSIAVGQVPGGLILNPNTGRLKGGFNAIGSYPVTLRLSDAVGAFVLRPYLLVVGNGPQFQGDGRLPDATAATVYRTDFPVASSLPIVEWQLGSGTASLPPGLTLVDRELIGTPTQPGKYVFELSVRDQNGSSAVQAFTLVVNPALDLVESSSLAVFPRGSAASWSLQRKGGSAPFRYLILSGTPPAGMQLNTNTGEISGSPQRVGDFGFTIEATDANGATARRLYLLQVVESFSLRLETLGSVLPLGRALTARIEAQGGVPPYRLQLSEGVLPPGLLLSGFSLAGTPIKSGAYPLSFTATDSSGLTNTRKWVITVSSGVEVFPSSLVFRVIANSSTAVRQTVKFQSFPTATAVQLESTAPWLKLSNSTSQTPGFVEAWVEPLLLPPGVSGAEIILRSGSQTRIPVSAERVDALASDWSVELFPGPGGSWGALIQAQAPRIPFSVSLDTIGIQQFNLSENKGDVLAPESFLLWLDRRSSASTQQRESSLAIRNLATGEEQRMVVPSGPVDGIEASASIIELSASQNATTSSSQAVNFRSTSPSAKAIAAISDQPWLLMENPEGRLDPNYVIRFSARPTGLKTGLNTALVELYDSSGKIALRLPVELWVGELVPPVELSEYAFTFSRKNPVRSLLLRNPSKTPVSYSARSSSALLRVSSPEGIIAADGEIKIELSAVEAALGAWSRHSVLISLNHSDVRIVEADFTLSPTAGICPSSAPVLSFLSPGAAFQATAGESQMIRVAVRNPCGEILTGSALSVMIPEESAVPLLPAKDGSWYGVWTPLFPAGSLNLEASWLDPANRQSVTRWLSGAVQP